LPLEQAFSTARASGRIGGNGSGFCVTAVERPFLKNSTVVVIQPIASARLIHGQ
jgi:hypothetical protein